METPPRSNERIVLPPPFTAYVDKTGVAQIRQMSRNLRLTQPQYLMNIEDAQFLAVSQEIEDAQSRLVGESAEHPIGSGHDFACTQTLA